jgi:phage tail sheath gpL-like
MAVGFNRIPPNLRVPLFWAEFDSTQASYLQLPQPACLIGHKATTAPANTLELYLVSSVDVAAALFGPASLLTDMVAAYRLNDPTGELWCIALPTPTGAAHATATLTFAGTPTAAGTVAVYVGDQRYPVPINVTDTPDTMAAALVAALAADPFAPATAAVGTAGSGLVTLTATVPGALGNTLVLGLNLRGLVGSEYVPGGVTVTLTTFTGGSGTPNVTPGLNLLADTEYDFVGVPWSDSATLDACQLAFGEESGRWAWNIQLYGHAFSAKADTAPNLVTFGKTRNDPHLTLMGYPAGSPTPPWKMCAALTAEAAVGLRADPARPLQTLPLVGCMIAPRGQRFAIQDDQSLLFAGIATCYADTANVVHIQRSITTYQRDAWGLADPSWLDVQTPATLQLMVRATRNRILTKFPRMKLADDGTRVGAGQPIVTPSVIRTELVALYSELEEAGLGENIDAFKQYLIVERDMNDPNRVNVLFPPDLVNQLRIFAMLVQFRLQYPSSAVAAAA